MNLKKLNFLSTLIIFILPILLVLVFLFLAIFQYSNNRKTLAQIADTDNLVIYLQEVLDDPELIYKANLSATETLLSENLNFSLTNFEYNWNYNVYLLAPNGDVFNVITLMNELKNDTTIPEALNYTHTSSGNGEYSLLIIETNNFIKGTTESLTYDFPDELLNYKDGERVSNFSNTNILTNKNNNFTVNKIINENYSLLEINFTLSNDNDNFEVMVPLNWFKNLTCQSIIVEA